MMSKMPLTLIVEGKEEVWRAEFIINKYYMYFINIKRQYGHGFSFSLICVYM